MSLPILARVADLVSTRSDLDEVLGPVLRELGESLGMARVALSLIDERREGVSIEAAHGLTPAEVRRGQYALGEGVIGRVVEDGAAAIVPSIDADDRFVDRTGARREGHDRSFVCVPIRTEGVVLGALSAYRPPSSPEVLSRDRDRLVIVAQMLAPAVRRRIDARPGPGPQPAAGRRPHNMIGTSRAMRQVYELVDQVADSTTTVLLRGESGTGKELVATAVHERSDRSGGPFVKVNCAALPETVIESELFGHERGAFTGAHSQRKGRFELAHRGTLFLDEIGDLSPATQIKLLRVLQERELERVGGSRPVPVDVRVVTATSRDLEQMQLEGTFRADLYYRLNVFPIRLPALRERKADILLLADHFVGIFNAAHGKSVRRITTPAIDMLVAYHWPGNVRELENSIERAVLLARDGVLHGHHLPPSLQTAESTGTAPRGGLRGQLDAVERELVVEALKTTGGNVARAARDLQVTERILGLRVRKYDIDPTRFKRSRGGRDDE